MAKNVEVVLNPNDFIISETDSKGNIILVNNDFCKISGFTQEDLIGNPHNIVRHKDMPKAAFKDLWDTIRAGNIWTGYVKNRTKDDGFYWVYATVSPFNSCSGEGGFVSCRKMATPEDIKEAEELYKTMS